MKKIIFCLFIILNFACAYNNKNLIIENQPEPATVLCHSFYDYQFSRRGVVCICGLKSEEGLYLPYNSYVEWLYDEELSEIGRDIYNGVGRIVLEVPEYFRESFVSITCHIKIEEVYMDEKGEKIKIIKLWRGNGFVYIG